MKKCFIIMEKISFQIILRNTVTAHIIYSSLPISGKANKWGNEYYFYTNLTIKNEESAKDVINKGEIAYWSVGNAVAIGYGTTPKSLGSEIRLADKCNIWADTDFNLDKLKNIYCLKTIKIIQAV